MKTVKSSRQKAGFVAMVVLTMLSLRCATSNVTGGSSSTVDNKVCGTIYDSSGKPADNASVVMRPFDYIPTDGPLGKRKGDRATIVHSTRTNSKGKFELITKDSIPAGIYCIEVRDNGGNCLLFQDIAIDSLFLKSEKSFEITSPRYDTKLKPPGTIKGTVPSLGDSLSGKVFVYGLDNYTVIDRNGDFVLENVPSGYLWIKIVAVESGTARNDIAFVITQTADTATVSGIYGAATIEIDASRSYQTIDGFGASSAWIGSRITNDLAAIFWRDDTLDGHIGLSLLRTRIDPAGYTGSEAGPMKKAILANPEMKIWSTSWTPPDRFMTDNRFNSDSASMQGFADHLVKYVQDVKKNADIDLYAVSCQNEPDTVGTDSGGCIWTGEQFRVFLKDFWGPACEKAGIAARRLIGESMRNDLAITDPSLTDTAAAHYTDIIGTHLYYGGPHPYPLAESLHKPYWATEVSDLQNVDTSIADALGWANQIHDCLVRCNMNAYHYWWLVNNGVADDDEGLCNSSGQPTPRMYTLGNFSKFIRPGFVRIAADGSPSADVKVSAFSGRSSNRVVIVAINGGIEMKIDITLPGITLGTVVDPWLTDSTHRLERRQSVAIFENRFAYTLPARSVVTFVLRDVVVP